MRRIHGTRGRRADAPGWSWIGQYRPLIKDDARRARMLLLADLMRRRFEHALKALEAGRPLYLRDGTPVM
ncbi:hypothetical protein Stsp02_63430 [Streptomyces sp. NBRC 14336]|nr:hypothetical protein Stsp02_63430 [Streptomyces sp. NBRC 14336]